MEPVRVGVIGCGRISPAYVKNLKQFFGRIVDVVACADIDAKRAGERAQELGIPKACGVDELVADRSVELVLNLTNPAGHHPVSMAALNAGKHVFVEKPLAFTREQGLEMLQTARAKGLTIAGAADTFLGAGLQTCRRLIDERALGEPGAAQALIGLTGKSDFYLSVYGGPLFDMAPYYLTALVSLLGPVTRVSGLTKTVAPASGEPSPLAFPFRTPISAAAALSFENGVIGTLHASGETCSYYPRVEVFCAGGTLRLNDANSYGGPLMTRSTTGVEQAVEPDPGFAEEGRGLGVAEQAQAIRTGRTPRAGGELMYHVLDVLHGVHDSSLANATVSVASTCSRPEPFDTRALLAG